MKELSEKERDKLYATTRNSQDKNPRFPEVTGLCRTCRSAHITKRQYESQPTVVCNYSERSVPMHLDIMECSNYSRRGQMSIDTMMDMALIVDPAERTGQYL